MTHEFHKGDRAVNPSQDLVFEVVKIARKNNQVFLFDSNGYAHPAVDCIPDSDDRPLLMSEFYTLLQMAENCTVEDLELFSFLTPEQKRSFWDVLDPALRDRLKNLKQINPSQNVHAEASFSPVKAG